MTIQDVINECLVALYSNGLVSSLLVLKGGTALSISENIRNRLSKDIDFSVSGKIRDPEIFFSEVGNVLRSHFYELKYEVFDYTFSKKPSKPDIETQSFWGGYEVQFKLIPIGHGIINLEDKRRKAFMPSGLDSTKITLEISEHEFCSLTKEFELRGVTIRAYDPALLVLEKLRAICQQHPEYKYRKYSKNRARDFFDIYQLVKKHRSKQFYKMLQENFSNVFDAKNVPREIVNKIFEPDFLEMQRDGFEEIKRTVSTEYHRIEDFDFFVEQLKLLIINIIGD